jgi:hypothetical protein
LYLFFIQKCKMEKLYIILSLLLIIGFSSTAQDLNYLKSEDTLYLVMPSFYPEKPIVIKSEKYELAISSNGITTQYVFSDKDTLTHHVFIEIMLNRDKSKSVIPSIIVNRRQFFKNHKKQILDLDLISKYRNEEFFFSYLGASAFAPSSKVIYIIDEESLKRKDKKIQLMRASLTTMGYLKI